ncbi:transcriptional regulator BetI [Methylobacterium indicum]|uniref:transcriptional regulator BetI n=3 Tax=Methylobacterium indicum TaxID=1775910 RepID=UPI000733DCDD|nr:transcriptional regulator BetI [Methylobacterium indicum]
MNRQETLQSFEAVRRRHLIEATIETLAEVGFKAASLSEIARRANVSTGLFAHYFGDKDGLLEATLRFMAARLARATAARLAEAATRRDRLFAVGDAALADEEFDRRTSAVWLAFWGQITHSRRFQRVQHVYQRRMVTNLSHALRGLVPEDCVATYATMISAMIDGLWLRSHVAAGGDGSDGDAAQARRTVHALIDGLLAGASPRPEAAAAPSIRVSRPADAAPSIRHLSPATGEEMACFSPARAAEIDRAVEDAVRSLAAWKALGAPGRGRVLRRCAERLRAEGADLARLESRETGRPLRHTAGPDLADALTLLERAAALAEGSATTWTDLGEGRVARLRRGPAGVVGAVLHWSAPVLGLCARAGALARGNALVVCADVRATRTLARLAALLVGAGFPEGVLTVLPGDAESAELLRAHPGLLGERDVAGGLDLGAGIGARKAGTIVLPGADPARVAAAILAGGRSWTGSSFASQSRLYVQTEALPGLLDALQAGAAGLRPGDPLDMATAIGPLVSPEHRAGLEAALDADLAAGARLATGGPAGSGWPAVLVLDRCTEEMRLVRGHAFAAVVAPIPFDDERGLAARLARGQGMDGPTAFGLFCGDPGRAWRLADALDADLCVINDDAPNRDGRGAAAIDPPAAGREQDRLMRVIGPGSGDVE